jgi:putative PIN family toxin of toxin-antitoxin system
MWIVLDSNIYISAALSVEGHSHSILKLAEKGLFEVSIADSITDEVERILKQKLRWPPGKIDLWMRYIRSFAHRVQPQQHVHDCSDPDDDAILECALEAHAQIIVTGDNHLLKLHPYRGIKILTPRVFLESGI